MTRQLQGFSYVEGSQIIELMVFNLTLMSAQIWKYGGLASALYKRVPDDFQLLQVMQLSQN